MLLIDRFLFDKYYLNQVRTVVFSIVFEQNLDKFAARGISRYKASRTLAERCHVPE